MSRTPVVVGMRAGRLARPPRWAGPRVDVVRVPVPRPAAGPRRRAARGRTAVAVAVAAYFAGQAGLNLAARNDWLPLRDPVYAEKLALFRTRPEFFAPAAPGGPVRVLAVGSSRTQLGFDAGRFAAAVGPGVAAFNFGTPGGGPLTADLYARRLLADGARPDLLLVELHPGCLAAADPPFEARWLPGSRVRPDEVAVLRDRGWAVPTPPHHGWAGWAAAGGAYRYAILNRYAPVLLPSPFGLTVNVNSDRHGYVPGIDLPARERSKALKRSHDQYAAVFPGYAVGGAAPAAVRDTLAVAAAHGIRTAVVVTPESSEFRGWYGPAGNAAVDRFAREVTAEFGVPLFDARTWVPDDGFADGHHLTAAGGATFTDRLAKESAAWVRGAR